jgi:hypothetical protein
MPEREHKPSPAWLLKLNNRLYQAWLKIKSLAGKVYPGKKAWRGAGVGIGVLGYLATIVMAVDVFLPAGWGYFALVLVLFPLVYGMGLALVFLILRLILKMPQIFLVGLGVGILLSMTAFGLFDQRGLFMSVVIALVGGLLGASIYTLLRGGWENLIPLRKVITLSGLVLGLAGTVLSLVWLLSPGKPVPTLSLTPETDFSPLANALPDPSVKGHYPVLTLTYGSGSDKRRSNFGQDVTIRTGTVDGSAFVEKWSSLRTTIWGFGPDSLPLNARVWYPDGVGPFPLVLVVHGNHLAEDYSDAGYAYLCELLASRGMICVSVDENFLNSSGVADWLGFRGLEDENDLRGWLLLEHLSLWRDFSKDDNNPFAGKVDLSRIGLIGHSRGGEAVAVAAAFNLLDRYPDNALLTFDYHFAIRSVVAIAPIDRQYQPADEPIPLENVDYLVLQGSHDMDLTSFDGYNAYQRVVFTDDAFHFKSAYFIWGANHGQFNTLWGDNDIGTPPIWLYNRGQLMSMEDQLQAAKATISAFMAITLQDEEGYLPLFENYQTGLGWLPETAFFNTYSDSTMTYFAGFEEDLDLTTGSAPGVTFTEKGLSTWREARVETRWGTMMSNSAVVLGWEKAGQNTFFTIYLPDSVEWHNTDQLVMSLAVNRNQNEEDPEPVNFSLVLIDNLGQTASIPLNRYGALHPEPVITLTKLGFLSDLAESEPVFQTYLIDLEDFNEVNPLLDLDNLMAFRLAFDRTSVGEVLLDDIGFRITTE